MGPVLHRRMYICVYIGFVWNGGRDPIEFIIFLRGPTKTQKVRKHFKCSTPN